MRFHGRVSQRCCFRAGAAAGAAVLVAGLCGPVAAQSIPGPLKVTDSGPSGSPGYAIKGITGFQNDAGVFGYGTVASSAINIDGVVGYVQTQQSVGVVGWAQSTGTSAYGVYGYSATGPGVYGYNNNGAVASIYGYGPAGNGVVGLTVTTSTQGGYAGVVGGDNSPVQTNVINYGVAGESINGDGVYAQTQAAMNGAAAVEAYAPGGAYAVDAYQQDGGNAAIHGDTDGGIASGFFEAESIGPARAGLIAVNYTMGGQGAIGLDTGEGGQFMGQSGSAAHPVLGAIEAAAGTYPLVTYNQANLGVGANGETFIVNDTAHASGHGYTTGSDVQVSGDLFVSGIVYTRCTTFPATAASQCAGTAGGTSRATSSGARVATYAADQSVPTMEDAGEAQLTNGQASVALERTFASTIDRNRSYLVFVTPEGDCHGLYVASKTANGFVVRELMGGHSSLAFEYRIVAHPYGDASVRLAELPSAKHAGARALHPRLMDPGVLAQLVAKVDGHTRKAAQRGLKPARMPARLPPAVVNLAK